MIRQEWWPRANQQALGPTEGRKGWKTLARTMTVGGTSLNEEIAVENLQQRKYVWEDLGLAPFLSFLNLPPSLTRL